MPTIYFHVGAHKTGTTYLQRFLSNNRGPLLDKGLQYISGSVRDGNHDSYGNGRSLLEFFRDASVSDKAFGDKLDVMLERYGCGIGMDVFVSDEDLLYLGQAGWSYIKAACCRADYELRVIFVIRSPLEYLESLYSHCCLAFAETRSPQQFVTEVRWDHIDRLRDFEYIFDNDQLIVLQYKPDILNLISTILNIDFHAEDFKSDSLPSNKAICLSEVHMMLLANRSGLAWISPLINKAVMRHDFPSEGTISFSAIGEVVSLVTSLYADDLTYLNQRYFSVTPMDLPKINGLCNAFEAPENNAYYIGFECLFSLLMECDSAYHAHLVSKLRAAIIKSGHGERDGLPLGFSPIEYLLLNKDVLFAGADPFEHYIKYGSAEGRQFAL